ncbi:hypothetical protein TNCV_4503731 [Trichonephila clavipes]|nr:hypothetical protein TNCV_4503731 [Trichonephila clavipes]
MYKNALKEDLIRVVENLDDTVESTDTIAKLKTKIENSSTFESEPDFVKTLIQNCIDEESIAKRKRDSPLVSMEIPLRTAYGQNGRCSMQPKPRSLRAQAQLKHELKLELVEEKQNSWTLERERERTREVREQVVTF